MTENIKMIIKNILPIFLIIILMCFIIAGCENNDLKSQLYGEWTNTNNLPPTPNAYGKTVTLTSTDTFDFNKDGTVQRISELTGGFYVEPLVFEYTFSVKDGYVYLYDDDKTLSVTLICLFESGTKKLVGLSLKDSDLFYEKK